MDEKNDLPSDEDLDKLDSIDNLSTKDILEDIKEQEEKKKSKEGGDKKKGPLSEEHFSLDSSEEKNIEPEVDTESDDKKKGLLLDIHDEEEELEEGEEKGSERNFSTEMAVAFIIAIFFAIVVFVIKVFNFSSVMGLIFTTLMFFIIWFGITMLTFFLMHSNFPKIYDLFFKMDEKLSMTSAVAAGNKDESLKSGDGSGEDELEDDVGDGEDFGSGSSEKPLVGSINTEDDAKVDDFDFSFDDKDVAKAVRSMISSDEASQDKKE